MAKYKKGTFVVVPNKDILEGEKAYIQSVFLWLCDHADISGMCFPSARLLAEEAGTGRSSVFNAIKRLEELNILKKKNRRKKYKQLSNEYQIMIVEKGGKKTTQSPPSDHLRVATQPTKRGTQSPPSDPFVVVYDTLVKPDQSPPGNHEQNPKLTKSSITKPIHIFPSKKSGISKEKKQETLETFSPETFQDGKKEADDFSATHVNIISGIELFRGLLPGEFSNPSSKPHGNPVTREVVASLIERKSLEGLRDMVNRFYERRNEKYAPAVGTIHEFCTFKLAKIEQFLEKSTRRDSPLLGDFGAKGIMKSEKERKLVEEIKARIKAKKTKKT